MECILDAVDLERGGGGENQLERVALMRIYCKCMKNENLFCGCRLWTIEGWSNVGVEYI